jgi:hypothetical protein
VIDTSLHNDVLCAFLQWVYTDTLPDNLAEDRREEFFSFCWQLSISAVVNYL